MATTVTEINDNIVFNSITRKQNGGEQVCVCFNLNMVVLKNIARHAAYTNIMT